MKLLPILALLLTALPTFARLGETKAQCEARYGKPVRTLDEGQILYHKAGLAVAITYLHDKALILAFYKDGDAPDAGQNDNKSLSEAELDSLLKANSDGSKWEQKPELLLDTIAWGRADLQAIAMYDREEKTLIIKDLDATIQIEEEDAKKAAGSLKDFGGFGETKVECDKRYGKPVGVDGKDAVYQKGDMQILITYWQGKAATVVFQRTSLHTGERKALSGTERLFILEANNEGFQWKEDKEDENPDRKVWHRTDGKVIAVYNVEDPSLALMAQDYLDHLKEEEQKEEVKKLDGF